MANYPSQDQLNIANKYGKTAVMVASEFGKYEIVKWIISTGLADLKKKTWRQLNALLLACSGERIMLSAVLIYIFDFVVVIVLRRLY